MIGDCGMLFADSRLSTTILNWKARKTLDDILYYTLLVINDKSFKNKNIPINIYAGKKIDEIKVKFNNFIKNISVIKNDNFTQVL